jgi:predicted metal-dependent HD superfamily phosphohydrolase
MDFLKAKEYIVERLQSELKPTLHYHGFRHTMDVLEAATMLSEKENISDRETVLLQTAALYHDTGFLFQYRLHEELSCELAREVLPGFGYSEDDLIIICGMIMATKIPQTPNNLLEQIICDADLDYLGRDDYPFSAETLYQEFLIHNVVDGPKTWNKLQIGFFNSHKYFTETAKKLRDKRKQEYLEMLITESATYQ